LPKSFDSLECGNLLPLFDLRQASSCVLIDFAQ